MTPSPLHHPLHSAITHFYNARAPTYDTEDTFHPALAADFIIWSAAQLAPRPAAAPLRMLDLCCGTGLVAHAARSRFGPAGGATIHGLDISRASLAIARAKATAATAAWDGEGSMEFWEGSAVDLDALAVATTNGALRKGAYGLLTCCSAFVLLPGDRAAVVRGWAEYLAPGGVLVFDVPARGAQLVSLFVSSALARYGVPVVDREWIVSEASVREVIVGAGLECRDVFVTRSYKEREYRVEDAEGVWKRMTGNPMSDVGGIRPEEREGAKKAFVAMMRDYAGESGVVKDEYRLLVGIGVKRT